MRKDIYPCRKEEKKENVFVEMPLRTYSPTNARHATGGHLRDVRKIVCQQESKTTQDVFGEMLP